MNDIIEIPLAGKATVVVAVDAADEKIVSCYRWYLRKSLDGHRYAIAFPWKKPAVRMHRIILDAPPGMDVDHRDGDGLNNRRSNLRLATRAQNCQHRTRLSKSNTSGVHGVYFDNRKVSLFPRWVAQIRVDRKTIFLGRFMTLEEAAATRLAAELRYFGEFAPSVE